MAGSLEARPVATAYRKSGCNSVRRGVPFLRRPALLCVAASPELRCIYFVNRCTAEPGEYVALRSANDANAMASHTCA